MIRMAAASLLSSSALGFHPAQQCNLSPADQWQSKAELDLPCLKGAASSLGAEGPRLPNCIKLVPTDTFLPFKLCLFLGGGGSFSVPLPVLIPQPRRLVLTVLLQPPECWDYTCVNMRGFYHLLRFWMVSLFSTAVTF